VSGTPDAAAVAEVVAAQVPVEENDADAVVAEHEAAADPTIVPVHHVESDAETEAKIEAEAAPKAAPKKPVAATSDEK
jgi:small subunit ribosomal protein S2